MRLALATAVSPAADLCQEIGDAPGAESNLKWMIQLYKDQIERPSSRNQFLGPLSTAYHNLGLVQWPSRARLPNVVTDVPMLPPQDSGHPAAIRVKVRAAGESTNAEHLSQ